MLRYVVMGAAVALMTAPSWGADAPRAPVGPPVVLPVIPQTVALDGFYAGGHVGYGWGNRQGCFDVGGFPAPSSCSPPDFDYNQRGWLAGAQVGVNRVLGAGGLVIGAEVTGSLADITGNLDMSGGDDFDGPGTYSWLATATAKLGWSTGSWMIYAEGGIGLGGFNYQSGGCTFDQVNSGAVYGVGAEVAMANNNSLFIEWNRYQFQRKDAACSFVFFVTVPVAVNTDPRVDVVRFGFNHYFN
jgi:hypothetical protein